MSSSLSPFTSPAADTALVAALDHALVEVERYVAQDGWDQQRKLFALVLTTELLAHEPALIGQLGAEDSSDPTTLPLLTPVEQENLPGETIAEMLAKITWPDDILGAILVLEIVAETTEHHNEGRLAVGVLRNNEQGQCALRWRHDPTGPLVRSSDLAPELIAGLLATFAA